MLLMEELFFMPFWGMPVMAGRSSGMTGVSFLCRLASCTAHMTQIILSFQQSFWKPGT